MCPHWSQIGHSPTPWGNMVSAWPDCTWSVSMLNKVDISSDMEATPDSGGTSSIWVTLEELLQTACMWPVLLQLQRSSWYICTCDTAVGLNWPNLVQLHCARVYPSPSRFPTRFPRYKLLPKQSGPDRPPAQYNSTKSSLYSCQEFKLSKSQAGCWQWEFAS